MADYEYVIVGAGAAGCVLASRLSADPSVSVCLIEAGGHDGHPFIHMPRGLAKLVRMPSHMYFYFTEPEPRTGMKPDVWLRGKVLGGSTSVNGMVWVRGHPGDYDDIAEQMGDDWSWQHIAQAYRDIENHELGAGKDRGGSGPLRISMPTERSPLTAAILDAGAAMGWPVAADINQPDDGVSSGFMPRTIWKGRRQSAAQAFLKPAMGRSNLTVMTGRTTDRVMFDGSRAVGIEVLDQSGARSEITARREVILCGGAMASPGILERSGIGDPALLAGLGIPLVHANSAVGEGVSEHRSIRMQWRLNRDALSFNRDYQGWRLPLSVLRYYLTHLGPMSSAAIEMRLAFRSRPDVARADIQAQLGLYSWDMASPGGGLEQTPGFCAVAYPVRPSSRGSIHINTPDPRALPRSKANFFASNEDRAIVLSAARQLREWAAQEPLASLIEVETAPGPAAQSDEAIFDAIDQYGAAGMHTVGSCRMGRDAGSVVDPEMRVRGVSGLRIMDTSVMPFIPAGNTQAPAMAMAWRAAEIVGREHA